MPDQKSIKIDRVIDLFCYNFGEESQDSLHFTFVLVDFDIICLKASKWYL